MLNWLVVKPAPRDFVESSVGGCDLHANKIRIAHKGKEGGEAQIAFCATQRKVVMGLMGYIKEYHTTGVRWNKTPSALATKDYKADGAAAPAAPATPAAPAPAAAPSAAAAAPVARPNLFAALNKGADITSGLKTGTCPCPYQCFCQCLCQHLCQCQCLCLCQCLPFPHPHTDTFPNHPHTHWSTPLTSYTHSH